MTEHSRRKRDNT